MVDKRLLYNQKGLSWTVLALAVLLLTGCIPFISVRTVVTVVPLVAKTCTQAGCIDSLRVNVQGELPQQFTVSVVGSDGSQLAAACDLARLAESHDACDDPNVDFYGEYFLFRTAPTEVILRIDWQAGRLERKLTPNYAWFYPNGPVCEPKCRQAKVEIAIP